MSPINITPVILCGGSGTRLWPLSRSAFPKQFLVLSGKTTLFQQAVDRLQHLQSANINLNETLIVTNEEHRFLVLDQSFCFLRQSFCLFDQISFWFFSYDVKHRQSKARCLAPFFC